MTTPAATYACHDREPAPDSVFVQDGWVDTYVRDNGPTRLSRAPVMVRIPNRMSRDCQYSKHTTDSRCAGCRSKPTETQQ